MGALLIANAIFVASDRNLQATQMMFKSQTLDALHFAAEVLLDDVRDAVAPGWVAAHGEDDQVPSLLGLVD